MWHAVIPVKSHLVVFCDFKTYLNLLQISTLFNKILKTDFQQNVTWDFNYYCQQALELNGYEKRKNIKKVKSHFKDNPFTWKCFKNSECLFQRGLQVLDISNIKLKFADIKLLPSSLRKLLLPDVGFPVNLVHLVHLDDLLIKSTSFGVLDLSQFSRNLKSLILGYFDGCIIGFMPPTLLLISVSNCYSMESVIFNKSLNEFYHNASNDKNILQMSEMQFNELYSSTYNDFKISIQSYLLEKKK